MKSLEKAQELIEKDLNIPKRTLFVAYLALCLEKPAAHPDDHLRNDGANPYEGWETILVHELLKQEISEDLHYPSAFLKLPIILEELETFHEDIFRNSDDDLDYQMWGNVGDVSDWFEEMDTKDIHLVIDALMKLYLYHAHENDTAEEEAEKHAGVLKNCHDVLLWIAQQPNGNPPKKVFQTIESLGAYCADACHDGVVKVRVEASCTTGKALEPQEFIFNVGGSEEFQTLLESIDVMTQYNYNNFSYTLV